MTSVLPLGIKSFGAYIPRRRMPRSVIAAAHAWALPGLKSMAKGEKSFCGWDEDSITMSVEAGRDCLRRAPDPASPIVGLSFASTTPPYADLQNAAIVGAALRLPESRRSADLAGSVRAGLTGLGQALEDGTPGDKLVIGADRRSGKPASVQEMLYGSGAAALRVGEGEGVIARFLGRESVTVPFVDHFRQTGEKFDYYWEERWIRDEGIGKIVAGTVTGLLKRLEVPTASVAHFGLSGGPAGSDKLVAKALAIAPERLLPDLQATVGDTGAAQPLLQLVAALERATVGDVIVIVSFAQGCEALAFQLLRTPPRVAGSGLAATLARRSEETAYLKMLSFDGGIELDWGMRAETDNKTALTQLYRIADQILGFVGGKCDACGVVQFPRFPACVNCGAVASQQPHPLADEPAKVVTFTADWLQYSPSPPMYMGLVQFDNGARLLMEMVDVGAGGLEVGMPLQMCFRIKERDRQRHFDRYFWKAAPV